MEPRFDRLTERQMECVRLRCQGMTHAQVGEALGISKHTVRSHVRTACAMIYGGRGNGLSVARMCYHLGIDDEGVAQ